MSYESKLKSAHDELRNAGIWKSNYNSPIFRLLRKFGVKVKPPYYNSFITNFLSNALFFGCVWGGFMWSLFWMPSGMDPLQAFIESATNAALFGFAIALYYLISSKKNRLSKWNDLER